MTKMPLTRQRVLRAAISYADDQGIESLSMRRLAKDLGAGAMSLYHHVSDKDDLLDGMIDIVAHEISPPPADLAWKLALRECAISAHQVLLSHRWATSLWGTRGPGPGKLRHLESILKVLRESGFSEEMSCRGFHSLTMHIVGFTLQVQELPFNNQTELVAVAESFLSELSHEDYPYFAEHVNHHLREPGGGSDFVYMLDLILDGLERDFLADPGRPGGNNADH